jgi:diguanylate cyclase (GGDEF)-like protein
MSPGLLADLWAALPVGVLLLNRDGDVTFANDAATAFFQPLEPMGRQLWALLRQAGLSDGGALSAAIEMQQASPPIRISLADGRILDSRTRPLPNGGAIVTLMDISLHVQNAELASRDPLTGLANRIALHQCLASMMTESRQTGVPVALLCIDLDRFKPVNDTLGHPVGDGLLVKVAERLRSTVRKTDLVARLGGDEFAILQAAAPQPESAESLATRLVEILGRPYNVSGHTLNIGASVGIAVYPADGNDGEALLRHGDLALYRAKADGRGAWRHFEPSMDAELAARRTLEAELRRAVEEGQFELAYQPQIGLQPDEIIGFEALLRWCNPTRGFVSPSSFIPLAEESGLIIPIGEWVLNTACREAARWPRPVTITVNISPLQLRDPMLLATVRAALESSGLDPARLELEMTEVALLTNSHGALPALQGLRALGVRISVDDFGTGRSSLSYLRKFPFNKIKIDQSFIRATDDSVDCGAIVRAVAALGTALGMKTVAEGVETAAQLERVRADGCTEVQGYFTGRPLPATTASALLGDPDQFQHLARTPPQV